MKQAITFKYFFKSTALASLLLPGVAFGAQEGLDGSQLKSVCSQIGIINGLKKKNQRRKRRKQLVQAIGDEYGVQVSLQDLTLQPRAFKDKFGNQDNTKGGKKGKKKEEKERITSLFLKV